ncbi:MAG: GNAT family N-acetyltransferase [Pseudomonadota bacterium]|nr:GNAT family N-acetyltransferase [Pseudomonadota bacterium]
MQPELSRDVEICRYTRPDRRAEVAAIDIMNTAFDPAYGEAWTAAQLTGFMSLPNVMLVLAMLDRAHLGFTLTRFVADEAELLLIATHPSWQKRGVGQLLLKDFIAHARKSRIGTLHLEVRDNNPAIDFYSRSGFEPVHRRPAYYRGRDGRFYDALSFQMIL